MDVTKIKPKVNTNYQQAKVKYQKEQEEKQKLKQQLISKKRKRSRTRSARPRETYLDKELRKIKQKVPERENLFKSILYAHNRYKTVNERKKKDIHEELKHRSVIHLLKEKAKEQERHTAKSRLRDKLNQFAEQVKKANYLKTEKQRLEGKMPGMYTAKLIQEKDEIKSRENQIEREKKIKAREMRESKKHIAIDQSDNVLLKKLYESESKKKKPKKVQDNDDATGKKQTTKNRNHDLHF